MKLKDLGDEIIFDVFPLAFNPKNKIILTHLLHLEKRTIPKKLPMIYTTSKIAEQLLSYADTNNYECIHRSNIVTIKPYHFIDICINRGQRVQVSFCSPKDEESHNLMVLIKENGKLICIYAGNFIDIRYALLDDNFASSISNGVENLYINLKRTKENHIFNDIDQMQKVFNKIDEIINCHLESRVHVYLPLFGYENFIFKLAYKFRNRIAKQSTLKTFYLGSQNNDSDAMPHFCDENVDKIFLFPGTSKPIQAELKFNRANIITINIINDRTKCVDKVVDLKNPYYELYYSPEPSPFQLKLMCMLFKPKRLFAIIDEFNNKSKVPFYLNKLRLGYKERMEEKEQRNLKNASTSQTHELPKNIYIGFVGTQIKPTKGQFLSDSESDSDE